MVDGTRRSRDISFHRTIKIICFGRRTRTLFNETFRVSPNAITTIKKNPFHFNPQGGFQPKLNYPPGFSNSLTQKVARILFLHRHWNLKQDKRRTMPTLKNPSQLGEEHWVWTQRTTCQGWWKLPWPQQQILQTLI